MHEGNIEGEVEIEDKCLQLLFVFSKMILSATDCVFILFYFILCQLKIFLFILYFHLLIFFFF